MPGWGSWVLVIGVVVVVVVVVLAALAVLLLAGTLVVSARESAGERERGIEA